MTPVFLSLLLLSANWTRADLEKSVSEVVKVSFQELKSVPVELEEVALKESFFATDVKNIFKPWEARIFSIQYSPKILEASKNSLTPKAVSAILAHELVHISHYQDLSRPELLWLAISYHFGGDEFQAKFERETDWRTIEKGYRLGLMEYRVWLYTQLAPKDAALKRKLYFTPEEMDALPKEFDQK